ncbi:MAG: ATP-dependent DNA ligase [archaeon]
MDYLELAEVYEKLESTSKRLEKTKIVHEALKKASIRDLPELIQLLQGRAFSAGDEKVIGMSSKLLAKAVAKSTGESADKVENLWSKKGDLGLAAEELTKHKKQRTLFSQKLTINKVLTNIRKLSEMTGEGTVNRKVDLISELLTSAEPLEARYICRTVTEELRAGVGPGILRDAITSAFLPKVVGINTEEKSKKNLHAKEPEDLKDLDGYNTITADDEKKAREIYNHLIETVQRAYDLTNDFAEVAETIKEKGFESLKKISMTPGKPIKVMLYEKAENIKDAFKKVGEPAAIEPKLDGFRIQIHRTKDKVILYTRRMENVTKQFPDVEAEATKNIRSRDYIVDGEIIGIDPKTGQIKPFQEISQRIKRKHNIKELIKKLPVKVMLFDIMEINGENMLQQPLENRRKKLKAIVKESKNLELVKQLITSNKEKAEEYYQKCLNEGNEGIMMKNLQGVYKPGLRVGFGVKVKPIMETLDLVITEAQWGEGKRSKWLSSFTLACRNEEDELFTIGKVGTGIKEKKEEGISFEEITDELKKHIITEKGKTVKVKPTLVIEISYQEIQKSPTYTSGYALRFPRVIRIRSERGVHDIATTKEIKKLYQSQKSVS